MQQTQKKKTAKPHSPEFREHAVRLAMERQFGRNAGSTLPPLGEIAHAPLNPAPI